MRKKNVALGRKHLSLKCVCDRLLIGIRVAFSSLLKRKLEKCLFWKTLCWKLEFNSNLLMEFKFYSKSKFPLKLESRNYFDKTFCQPSFVYTVADISLRKWIKNRISYGWKIRRRWARLAKRWRATVGPSSIALRKSEPVLNIRKKTGLV